MTGHPRARRGFVLLFTLLASMVAAVLGVSALAYVRLERADAQAFARTTSHEQALSTGVEEALALLHAFPDPRRVICERNGGDPDLTHAGALPAFADPHPDRVFHADQPAGVARPDRCDQFIHVVSHCAPASRPICHTRQPSGPLTRGRAVARVDTRERPGRALSSGEKT